MLLPHADGCLLCLRHRGFDLTKPKYRFTFDNMGPGWRDLVLPRLTEPDSGLDINLEDWHDGPHSEWPSRRGKSYRTVWPEIKPARGRAA